ncbi:conserved hypothetical protein [Thermotomaculum hydrothermale]|uniref:Tetratricopeptide repeat protein n=1 Tax=Thermotomaculum hydrothermale TaxID=981385 RepID=A0A7R6PGW8_9BACT|nr:tetratricopeptide repeat protein [Thermotomaculum hydrothermale]BBB33543.1 conserved hypothetical protein [Thermotomaculum hydrothermale]
MISKGVEYHDKGMYREALDMYKKVLKLNPDNVTALSETAFTYFAMGDYEKSLEYALKAARYKTNVLGHIYTEIGNAFDALNKPYYALAYYREAIKKQPDYFLGYYNAGITLERLGYRDKAKECYKKALTLNPNHSSSTLMLGNYYYQNGCSISALLLFYRFLILEPDTQRSEAVFEAINDILGGMVEEKKKDVLSVKLKETGGDCGGDFSSVFMSFGIIRMFSFADRKTKKGKSESEIERISFEMESLFSILENNKKKKEGFVWEFYAPYYAELKKRGYVMPLVMQVFYRKYQAAAKKWFKDEKNAKLYDEFIKWSVEGYKFLKLKIKWEF